MDEEVRKKFEEIEEKLRMIEGKNALNTSVVVTKNKSIKEFLIDKNPPRDFHKTLTIAYYLEKHMNMKSLNAKDIEEGYRAAKENVPENINYKVIQNIKSGYMMETKDKKDNFKAWTLTITGEKFVDNGFDKNDKPK